MVCRGLLQRSLLAASLVLSTGAVCHASGLTQQQQNDKSSAKESNVAAAKQLNGDTDVDKKKAQDEKKGQEKLGGPSALSDQKNKEDAKKTADVVNQVPGVKVSQQDMQPPADKPIKGFHPIKKLLRPVENLEGMSIKLEQQIMKLEGPIAGLQPPMINLQKKMVTVDDHIGQMGNQLTTMQGQVTGVRQDIANMRKDIEALKEPIVALKAPIGTVAKPLETLQTQLNFILMAILVAAFAIAIGTPIAAVVMYRNRHKLFPDMKEHDLPKVETPPATSSRR
ncbi:MAG TPA: hypothetical protein V6C81_18925 [Planktothrix sp.]|jgi:chromosome segregation ATPase